MNISNLENNWISHNISHNIQSDSGWSNICMYLFVLKTVFLFDLIRLYGILLLHYASVNL